MALLKSKRFWAAVIGIGAIIAVDQYGLNPEMVNQITDHIKDIVITVIAAYGAQDVAATMKGAKK
jgi:hypothetical protein